MLEDLEKPQRGDFWEDLVSSGPDISNHLLHKAISHYCSSVQDSLRYLPC